MSSKFLKIYLFVFFSAITFSCKKDSNQNQITNTTPIATTRPNSFDGDFVLSRDFSVVSGSLFLEGNSVEVYFSDSLFNGVYFGISHTVNGGTVFLNDIQLKRDTSYNSCLYMDTTAMAISKPCTWRVIGVNSFPSFNFQDHSPFPKYTGYLDLPSSLSCMGANEIRITNCDAESAILFIDSGGGILYKEIDTIGKSIKLNNAELAKAGILPGPDAHFSITLLKTSFKRIGNKVYRFTSKNSYNYYLEITD